MHTSMSEILLTHQTNWQPQTKQERSFAAIAAILISLTFFAQFNQQFVPNNPPDKLGNSKQLFLSWISVTKTTTAPQKIEVTPNTPKKIAPNKVALNAISKQRPIDGVMREQPATSITSINKETTNETVKETAIADPLANTATQEPTFSAAGKTSIHLGKPNSAAIRAAYEASKSDIQKMADASNKTLINTPASKYEQFQGAANRAAKPDCLRQGGSILSLLVVAYQAATDHCK